MSAAKYTKKQREWIESQIHRVCRFRSFLKKEEEARDPGQKRKFRQKKEHVLKLLDRHMTYASQTKLFSDAEIKQLNVVIRQRIERDKKSPEEIIEELLGRKN